MTDQIGRLVRAAVNNDPWEALRVAVEQLEKVDAEVAEMRALNRQLENDVERLGREGQTARALLGNQRGVASIYRTEMQRRRNERDEARAMVARVREATSRHPECDRYAEGEPVSCGWKHAYADARAAVASAASDPHTGADDACSPGRSAETGPEGHATGRSPHDRFQWDDDGDSLDEIVLSNVTFHMERMGHHAWWIGISDGNGDDLAINFSADREPSMDPQTAWPGVRREIRGPLLYHLAPWRDRNEREHRCEVDGGHERCRCECGATRQNPEQTPKPRETR